MESSHVAAFAVRGCVQEICPEMLILGKSPVFLHKSGRSWKEPGVCRGGFGGCPFTLSPEPAPVQGSGIQPSTPRPHCYPSALTQPVVWLLPPPFTQAKSPSGAFGKKLMLVLGIVKIFMSIFS